jgi:hypothetical protein
LRGVLCGRCGYRCSNRPCRPSRTAFLGGSALACDALWGHAAPPFGSRLSSLGRLSQAAMASSGCSSLTRGPRKPQVWHTIPNGVLAPISGHISDPLHLGHGFITHRLSGR